MRTAFDNCNDRQGGRVCLVTGAVGSGKTALLEAFSEYVTARAGRVVSAVGSQAARGFHFGVVSQLLDSSGLDKESAHRLTAMMRQAELSASAHRAGESPGAAAPDWQSLAPLIHGLFTSLLDLAAPVPLVLTVDDVHHADVPSLHCLLYAVLRLRHRRMMMVLTESSMLRSPHAMFRAELLSQPHFFGIGLQALSGDALARAAGGGQSPDALRRAAEQRRALTGGSPLLLRGLLDEESAAGTDAWAASPRHGVGTFDQAVHRCLYRHEPEVRRVAQALAVLGRPTAPLVLGAVLGLSPEFAARAMDLLRMSGLVADDGLRHPRITRSVLADLPAAERRDLHRRAAEALHDHGAEPAPIAEHLVAAGWAEAPWAASVLHAAADQALASGRPDIASACLRLTGRCGTDLARWTGTDTMLVRARWQINPLTAGALLDRLPDAAHTPEVPAVVPHLLWQGGVERAMGIVSRWDGERAVPPAARAQLDAVRLLVSLTYPDHLPEVRADACRAADTGAPVTAGGLHPAAMALLADALLPERSGRDVVGRAERLIQRHMADHGSVGLLIAPLLAMLFAGRADLASPWSRALLGQSCVRNAPSWKAVLHAVRAEAALRLGRVAEAEEQGRAALTELTPQAWGVAVAAPYATLISAATEDERFGEADRWLARPVPADALRTPLGLLYLAARARFHLATGHPHAAAEDLRWCGRMMAEWRMDVAALVPWRLELAGVHLTLGDRGRAARLLEEQMAPERAVDDRTRGRALLALSGIVPPERGQALLAQAVKALEACGDRLALARVPGAGQAGRRPGGAGGARPVPLRAHQPPQEPTGETLAQRAARAAADLAPRPPKARAQHVPEDGLSQAERRVAALAAQGHTNREISSKLFITVSTVEQHLTRVYRKLNIKHRADLAPRLTAAGAGLPQPDG
ncbi:LuxR family transcriptional regulator [Streptomyces capparidis]